MVPNKFDEYFENVLPLVAAIAMLKTFLAEELGKKSILEIEKTRKRALTAEQERAVQIAMDAAIAQMNPDYFNLPADWAPKSETDVKRKLLELKDATFKDHLIQQVVKEFTEPQRRLQS
jgi:hypothetical protein